MLKRENGDREKIDWIVKKNRYTVRRLVDRYAEGKRDGRRLGILRGIIWSSVGWMVLLVLIRNILIWRG